MSQKIRGIFTPHMVPLDEQGQINEPELRRYIDWLIDRGVHGLYPNGSTGEFVRFTAEERRRIVKIVCEQAAGRVPVLAGAAEADVKETLAACETYAQYGARAVAIVSPFYYKLGPESVYTMLYSADFPEGFRAAVELRGFHLGRSRQPQSDAQRIDSAALQSVLRCIFSDFGYVEAPPEGCPVRTGNIDQDRVSHIAASVIQKLRERGAL